MGRLTEPNYNEGQTIHQLDTTARWRIKDALKFYQPSVQRTPLNPVWMTLSIRLPVTW